jgi:hypothetical protein
LIGAILLIFVLYFMTQPLLQSMKRGKRWFSINTMNNLFWYHMFFAGVYYVMTLSSRSDSVGYYLKPQYLSSWFEAYETGTKFIEFLAYPFINYLKFTYEMMMVLFAWVGYWGFVYFYVFFKENIKYKHTFQGYDLISLFIFLPNMHYWTASLGKGAPIFLALAMVTYGLSNLKFRKQTLILGLLLVYHVRPHIFLFMVIGIVVGIFTGRQKVPFYQKFLVFAGSAIALVLMYDQIMGFVGLDSSNLLESFDQFSNKRSFELAKANSGIDTSNYPLLLKLFTFWFRPLFVDAPGPVGLIVSFENLLYLYLTLKLFSGRFIKFMSKGSALVKTSAVVFLATSLALAETLSNMGIIIRQKSMVMYFLLFIIISFLDYQKEIRMQRKLRVLELKKVREQEDLQLIQA